MCSSDLHTRQGAKQEKEEAGNSGKFLYEGARVLLDGLEFFVGTFREISLGLGEHLAHSLSHELLGSEADCREAASAAAKASGAGLVYGISLE